MLITNVTLNEAPGLAESFLNQEKQGVLQASVQTS